MSITTRFLALACACALVFANVPVALAIVPEGNVTLDAVVPASHGTCLASASGIAYQPGTDKVFVVDATAKAVHRFSADGSTLEWTFTDANGEVFLEPTDVAADTHGFIYIADAGRGYVYKLNATTGALVDKLGTGLIDAVGLDWFEIGGQPFVYVTDKGQHKLLRFVATGDATAGFGFTAGGQLSAPSDVDVEYTADGLMYWVVDSATSKVFCIKWDSSVVTQWQLALNPEGETPGLVGIARDTYPASNGSVIISDGNGGVHRYTPGGVYTDTIAPHGVGEGTVTSPARIDCDPSNSQLYVCDNGGGRAVKLSQYSDQLAVYGGGAGSAPGEFCGPQGIEADAAGNVYVADTLNNRIQKLDANGAPLSTWGEYGTGPGQFDTPYGVTVDIDGNIYVADTMNNRIQKLSPEGEWIASFGELGDGPGQFEQPRGVAVGSDGSIYVADTMNWRVQKLNAAGDPEWSMDSYYDGAQWFFLMRPTDIVVGPGEHVYTFSDRQVQEFKSDSTFVRDWGIGAGNISEFTDFCGIDVSPSNTTYIADPYYNNIKLRRLRTSSTVRQFGATGSGPALFTSASDVAFGAFGSIWVTDSALHRIQRFTMHDTTPPTTVAASSEGWVRGASDSVTIYEPTDAYAGWVTTYLSRNFAAPEAIHSSADEPGSTTYDLFTETEEGTTTFQYWSVDAYGNEEETQTAYIRIDRGAPSVAATTTPPSNGWVNHDLTITAEASDTVSGVKALRMGVGGGPEYAGPISITAEGAFYHVFQAEDRAGNWSEPVYVPAFIDKSGPTPWAIPASAEVTNPRMIFVGGTDEPSITANSGVATTYWRLDDGEIQIGNFADVAFPGTHSIETWSVDNAGNLGTSTTLEFEVASAPPQGDSFVVDGGASWTNKIDVATSNNVLGATEMRFDPGDGNWTEWQPYASEATVTLPDGNADRNVHAEFRNAADERLELTYTIAVDRTAPTSSCNVNDVENWDAPAQLYFVGGDTGGSGLTHVYYRLDGGDKTIAPDASALEVVEPGVHELEWWAEDVAGNIEQSHTDQFNVNKALTTTAVKASASTVTYPSAVTLTATLKDGTGVALPTKLVQFQYYSSGWKTLGAPAVTNALGQATLRTTPTGASKYRATFVEDALFVGSASGSVSVSVNPTLSTPVMSSTVTHRKTFTVYSLLRPYHTSGTSNVVFKFYRMSGSKQIYVKSVRGKNAKYNSTTTKVSASTSLTTTGTYRVYAYHPADSQRVKTSAYKKFVVK